MRPGRHAAEDGSFRRSAGTAAGRGALLLLVAVVLGVILLNKTDDSGQTTVSQTSDTTAKAKKSSPTTAPTFLTTTTAPPAHDPAAVKVLAVNGTDTAGVGSRAKDVLLAARYNALSPTDAKNKPVAATVIFFAPGYQPDANAIALLLHVTTPTSIQPMPADRAAIVKDPRNVAAAHVIVVVGGDIANSLPKASPSSTTSTTKKPTSSSTTSTTAKSTTTTAKP